MRIADPIEVREFVPEQAGEWKEFLSQSVNGTLFHDLDFLSYHPPGRFSHNHLVFYRKEKIIALLPAAIVEEQGGGRLLKSPYGASVGGFATAANLNPDSLVALAQCLNEYVKVSGLDGAEMRLGPSLYSSEPEDTIFYALMSQGWKLANCWLTPIVPLHSIDPSRVAERFSESKKRDLRYGRNKGVVVREAGVDELGLFYRILLDTELKHGASPTHKLEELGRLCELVPGRIRIFISNLGEIAIAGALVFILNRQAAYTFYICQLSQYQSACGTAVLLGRVAEVLAREGYRYLDLGPTSFNDMTLNLGLNYFKTGFGARGFLRTQWSWFYTDKERGTRS